MFELDQRLYGKIPPLKRLHNHHILKHRRKLLRKNSTRAEIVLWSYIKKRQLKGRKFRRQYSIGPYIIDFYCHDESLAVEVDGPIHQLLSQQVYDAERTQFLEGHGITVIRISNEAVLNTPESVLDYITSYFGSSGPSPSASSLG